MRFFGLTDELAGATREEDVEPDGCEIWLENLPTLNIFLSLYNQWHLVCAPDGEMVRAGFRCDAIESFFKHTKGIRRRNQPAIFADLIAMQDAAMGVMNLARAKRREKRQAEIDAVKRSQ